jgi:hypothetical protein
LLAVPCQSIPKQAGGSRFRCTLSLPTWPAAVTGQSCCAEPTKNFRVASILGGGFGTPNGLVVSAPQPAKCLTNRKKAGALGGNWNPRRIHSAALREGREQKRASPAPSIAGDPSAQDARDAYWQSIGLGAVDRPSDSPVNTFATWLLPVHVPFTMYRVPVKIPVQIARHPTRPSA